MSNDDFKRESTPNPVADRAGSYGATIAAIIVAAVIVVALLVWTPWRGTKNTTAHDPSTTVGSSSTAPKAGGTTSNR